MELHMIEMLFILIYDLQSWEDQVTKRFSSYIWSNDDFEYSYWPYTLPAFKSWRFGYIWFSSTQH